MLRISFLFIIISLLLSSCSYEPVDIEFGVDECYHCRMTISDHKYGAEIVNKNGKTFKFDALECMAKYINEGNIEDDNIHSLWTINYTNPGELIDAKQAFILRSRSLPSPMAMFFTSFASKTDLEKVKEEHPGETLGWEDVINIVKEEWE